MTQETMLFDNKSFERKAHYNLSRTLAYDFVSKNIAPYAHVNDAAFHTPLIRIIHPPALTNTFIS